jgi:ABC-type transport system substrate-binding protein
MLLVMLLALVPLIAVACGESAAPVPEATAAPVVQATAAPAATTAPVPTAMPAATAVPASAAKVKRVIMSMPPIHETNRIWAGPWSLLTQHIPFAETLLANNPATGAAEPGLATSWSSNDDFTEWSFDLRQGVPFHYGWGEFSAADVENIFNLLSGEDSVATMSSVWRTEQIVVENDSRVTFKFPNPYLDGLRLFSKTSGDMYLLSKAQMDAEGVEGIDEKPAGTGHYQYVDREIGQRVWYEIAETTHWDGITPDFQEFQISFVFEDATRLAQLLSGDAHVVMLSRDLQADSVSRGMKIIQSQGPANQTVVLGLGQYHLTGDPTQVDREPSPLDNILVREAMNRAVNRAELLEFIYKGGADPVYVYGFVPFHEGWSPRWPAEFEDKYGYDPERARELIAEAGYAPGEIEFDYASFPIPANPEMPQLAEAMQLYFDEVGIKINLKEVEYAAIRPSIVEKKAYDLMMGSRDLPIRTTQEFVRVFFADEGIVHAYVNDFIEEQYALLKNTIDPAEREAIAQTLGDYFFDNYLNIPIAQIFFEIVVDPKIVEDWVFSGQTPTSMDHFHLIKAAK